LGALITGMTGCESLRSWRRTGAEQEARSYYSDDEIKPAAVQSDTSKIMGVNSDSSNPTPFFSNTRRWSGLSPEARDIERNLGVN
jgi:hypothetical protein